MQVARKSKCELFPTSYSKWACICRPLEVWAAPAGSPRNAIILELTVILDFFGDLGAHETSILVHLGRLQTSNARKFQRKSHQHTLILQNWERYDGSFQYASDIRSGARLRPLPSSHELRELLSTSLSQQAQDRALR